MTMIDCYIYYKAFSEKREDVTRCASVLQDSMSAILRGEILLQRRPVASNDIDTWMEIYRQIPSATAEEFANLIAPALSESGLEMYLIGERRIELFVSIA